MVPSCAWWGLIAGLSSAAPALAQGPARALEPSDYAMEVVLAAHVAGYFSDVNDDAALLGGTTLLRAGPFEGGAGVSMGGPLFEDSVFNASLLGGFGLQ